MFLLRRFHDFGGWNSFLPLLFLSCNTRQILNREDRTISGTSKLLKYKEGRIRKDPKTNAANLALPLPTFLPSRFAFPTCPAVSYLCCFEHSAYYVIKEVQEGMIFGFQNSQKAIKKTVARQTSAVLLPYAFTLIYFIGFYKCTFGAKSDNVLVSNA